MKNTLLVFGHRNPLESKFGKALFDSAISLDSVTGHILMDQYPNLKIDGGGERALLEAHQNIVLQFPFYWYSSPAIIKEWLDEVLSRGWAYGGGQALAGKKLLIAISTGGPEKVYQNDGANKFTVEEFLRPFEQTANLCGMEWQEPFVMYGVRYLGEQEVAQYCEDYKRRVVLLS